MNQCDGCQRRLPLRGGIHRDPNAPGWGLIGCTRDRYEVLDYLGNVVEPGKVVAYNLSGGVAIGEVVRAEIFSQSSATFTPHYKNIYKIDIKLIVQFPGKEVGHISHVKDPSNLLVVDLTPAFFNSL